MANGKPRQPSGKAQPGRPAASPPTATVRPPYRLLGLLLALLPLAAWPEDQWVMPYSDLKWPLAAAGMLACLLLIFREIPRSDHNDPTPSRYAWSPWLAGGLLIPFGLLLSSLASPVIGLGLWTGLRETLFVLFALGLALLRPNRRELRWVLGCLLLAMSAQALLALVQRSAPGLVNALLPWRVPVTGERAAMIGSIGNPEYLASWLAVGLSIAVILAFRPGRARDPLRWQATVAALLLLAEIFISGGRGAILASLAALGVTVLLAVIGHLKNPDRPATPDESSHISHTSHPSHPSHSRHSLLISLAGLALLCLLLGVIWLGLRPRERGVALPARLAELTNVYSPSVRHRIGLLAATSRMILDHPLLGAGPGLYGKAYAETVIGLARDDQGKGFWALNEVLTGNYVGEAHCDPLQWWSEYGLLPALGLSLMILGALWRGRSALLRGSTLQRISALQIAPAADGLRLALWAGVLTMALNMWVSFPLHAPIRALTFWALLGLLWSATDSDAK